MGRRKSKSKRLFTVIEIILIILIAGMCYSYYYFDNKLKDNNKEHKKLTDNISLIEKDYNEKTKELDSINKEIEKYNKIDETISKTQEEYFNYAKELEQNVKDKKTDKKIVYLTFDDGPYYNTYKVLDILDQYKVKATFFTISMNGQYCYDNKNEDCFKLYKEYVKRGHTIANHTYTHGLRTGLYSSVNSFMDAIDKQEEHIKNQSGGYVARIVRFPGGSPTAGNLKQPIIEKLREKGYGWVDWTSLDGDAEGVASEEQAWQYLKSTMNDDIEVILFHDYNRITTSILPGFIEYLQNNNYVLLPLFYDSVMIKK